MNEMIELKNVSFGYDKTEKIIDDLSLTIYERESVGLIGANGAGKSTLLKLIIGSLEAEGQILVNGTEVKKENLKRNHLDCGYLFQNSDHQMFMPTVYEDLLFGLINNRIDRKEADDRIDRVLADLDIAYLKKRYNHKISMGEKKMAAIAVILAMDPKVVLLDEPTAGLDPCNRRRVIEEIRKMEQTKLITSHDLDMIMDTCEKVALINDGRLVAFDDTEKILTNKKLLEENRLELPLSLQRG